MELKNLNQARPRINAEMFSKYLGRAVCVVGMAGETDQVGTSFTLTTCDKQKVTVKSNQPLQELVHGLVEVHGVVKGRNELQCNTYVLFRDTNNFDMESYNKAVKLAEQYPQHYIIAE